MALADTARLVASLELKDEFTRTAQRFDRTLGGIERQTSSLSRIGGEVSRGLRNTGRNLVFLGAAGATFIGTQVAAGVRSLAELERVEAQTDAVLKSTRGAAGQTAGDIRELSEGFEDLNATIDDKVIQSGANLLLTFTNIRDDAFAPTLQAALDMNQALGGGPEGLQTAIIQIGKAMQDPVRGATALRRVGVNLSEEQAAQIQKLVDKGKLQEAQQIILNELAVEFGGSFEAAGDTAEGKLASVRDAIEGAQQSLATAFLPVLEKAGDKLEEFLSRPEVLQGIQDFGTDLAKGFDDLVEFAGNIPWGTIGESLRIAGRGAKALFDAFTGLPDWVQTAVITGWGLNKLTGGALGNIAGILGENLFSRGSTPLNPLFVSPVGGGLGGGVGGPVVAGGKGGGRLGGLGGNLLKLIPVVIAAEIASQVQPEVQDLAEDLHHSFGLDQDWNPFKGMGPDDWQWPLGSKNTPDWWATIFGGEAPDPGGTPFGQFNPANQGGTRAPIKQLDESIDATRREVKDLHNPLAALKAINQGQRQDARSSDRAMLGSLQGVQNAQRNADQNARVAAQRTAQHLQQVENAERHTAGRVDNNTGVLARKELISNVDVSVSTAVSVKDVISHVITHHVASGVRGGFSEF